MENGRRRRGRPKYTVLDLSKVDQQEKVDEAANSENGALVKENEEEEGDVVSSGKGQGDTRNGSDKEDIRGEGQSEVDNLDATCSDEFPEDLDFDENLWGVDDNDEEERGRKRDKGAEYHLFVKTHQKRRHRGSRHRARSSS